MGNLDYAKKGLKLQEFRKFEGLSQTELGAKIGASYSQISSWERGEVPIPRMAEIALAREVGLNLAWLEGRSKEMLVAEPSEPGFQVPTGIPDDIPVVGRGRGGRGSYSVDGFPVGEGFKRVRRPYDVDDPNAFGVEVEGVSMSPKFESGDIVICSPKKGWRSGNYVVVVTKEGEALVKKIKDQGDSVILSSIAPGFDPVLMHKSEIRGIHRIVWVKPK